MGGASGIEFFSLLFTAGVAAGAILAGSQNWLICAVILPLSALPCFFPEQIKNAGRRTSELVFSVTFILLGLFCALSSTLIPEDTPGALELLAGNSAERLRDLIGRIPFQSPDSEALIKALITGDRNGLTRGSVRVFRESGASHILALSGLHVGIIYLAADRIIRFSLGRAPWTRGIRFVLIVGAGAWFTLMTG
ncbi:MAG: ComEC/Rec2 family competence protein, partial [Bacteroidales bacterium]|nr:ComEC/Rec2 family competence protein [Bacteroidales bacterium]